jgi:hypothetical protein
MKKAFNTSVCILWIAFLCGTATNVVAQDSSVAEPSVNLRYFVNNNSTQYLLVQSRSKIGKKFKPLPRQVVQLYLDSNNAAYLITKTYTDEDGLAKVIIPPSLKDQWNSSAQHQFIGVLEASSKEDERTTSLDITKAKMEIDTSTTDSVHTINVNVKFFQNNDWVPAKEVEMKVGINRSGSILSAGDEETYTTDSSGTLSVELKKNNLPGDQQGNLVLNAKVEDNDKYGNLLVEKIVPWGVPVKYDNKFFDQRTLWSTRYRTPLWLLFMAYGIMIAVWGTLIYLVVQIIRIKKLGTSI